MEVVFYKDVDDTVPVLAWLQELRRRQPRVFAKCQVRIKRLSEIGHELRRPEADYLRDGIHELRIRIGTVNYRILYFFHAQKIAVLAHALTQEAAVPVRDIDQAVERMRNFLAEPNKYTYREPVIEKAEADIEDD